MRQLILATFLVVGALAPQHGYSKSLELPAVRVPFVTIGTDSASYLLVSVGCYREATIFEYLNNGLDSYEPCDEFSKNPKNNIREGILVQVNSDGSVNVPTITIDYNGGKLFKDTILCVELVPVLKVESAPGGSYVVDPPTRDRISFCSDLKHARRTGNNDHFYQLDLYEKGLSQGLYFSSAIK